MSTQVKVSGSWVDMSSPPYAKVSGLWKTAKSSWVKANGQWRSWFLQGGIVDAPIPPAPLDGANPDFSSYSGIGPSGDVFGVAVQSDGKILAVGTFGSYNVESTNGAIRLNADGSRDRPFYSNLGNGFISGTPVAIAIQPDGKILMAGGFTTLNSATANRIVRLNSDGTRDTAFTTNNGTGANNTVRAVAIQSDGKIVLGGQFTSFNGATANYIVRLNADGTRDADFTTNNGTGANGDIRTLAIQSDGKILAAGDFTAFSGATARYVVRLNPDGTRDADFTTNNGTGFSFGSNVRAVVVQPSGKIVLGGQFTSFNGATANYIVRLNADGTRDADFTTNNGTGPNNIVDAVASQTDGKILVAGQFTSFNNYLLRRLVRLEEDGTISEGQGPNDPISSVAIQPDGKLLIVGSFQTFSSKVVNRIARLNSNGSLDTQFAPTANAIFANINSGLNSSGSVVRVQTDSKILVVGDFTRYMGATVNGIVRLNPDGTRDTAFTSNTGTGTNSSALDMAIQSDGKIVLGGIFTTFNGAVANRIVRLNADGTRDADFTTNNGTGPGNNVFAVAIQPDGKILVGGLFISFNGVTANRIVRLNSDGTRDADFTTNNGTGPNNLVTAIGVQSDGKILIGGPFTSFNGATANRIVRLNPDGTRDATFTTNNGTGPGSTVNSIAIQSDGKIVLGGIFTTFNGAVANSIVRLNADGTRDTAFTTNNGTGVGGAVLNPNINEFAIQSDGKIVFIGSFTTVNGKLHPYLCRIGGDAAL